VKLEITQVNLSIRRVFGDNSVILVSRWSFFENRADMLQEVQSGHGLDKDGLESPVCEIPRSLAVLAAVLLLSLFDIRKRS